MRRFLVAFAFALASALAGSARAEPSTEPRVLPARRCAALFGCRKMLVYPLRWIAEERAGITVAHSNPRWKEPVRVRFSALRFVGISALKRAAVVELERRLALRLRCEPARYLISPGDQIGRRSRVLAVLPRKRIVLVEVRGELRYLSGAAKPRWLMAWQMRGELARPARRGHLVSKGRRPTPRRKAPPRRKKAPRRK